MVWLGCASVIVCVVGIIYKIITYKSLPRGISVPLYPIPTARRRYIVQEVLLFRGILRQDPVLWFLTLTFHWGIYLLFFYYAAQALNFLVINGDGALTKVIWSCSVTSGSIGSCGLLVRRMVLKRLRSFTGAERWFNLGLLGFIFWTGLYMSLAKDTSTVAFLVEGGGGYILWLEKVHILSFCLFLAILPWGNMAHFITKFFSYHWMRWGEKKPRLAEIKNALERDLSWNIVGKRTRWRDILGEM